MELCIMLLSRFPWNPAWQSCRQRKDTVHNPHDLLVRNLDSILQLLSSQVCSMCNTAIFSLLQTSFKKLWALTWLVRSYIWRGWSQSTNAFLWIYDSIMKSIALLQLRLPTYASNPTIRSRALKIKSTLNSLPVRNTRRASVSCRL
jgi:hypothetical protein